MEDTKHGTRKLAAIMFTDMVGFSALTQKDEALALELLGEHNDIFREVLAKHEGREVKSTGDGFLLEFPSALTAVQCAIEVQQTIHDRNLVEDDKIGVRIGIHVGDVVAKDGDIFGDGVNIASRIEPLADAGGICVSASVAQQVENKIPNAVAAIGKAELKNIELPMEIHKVFMPWEVGAPVKKIKKKHSPLTVALAVAVVLLVGFGTWSVMQSQKAPDVASSQLSESQELELQARELLEAPLYYRVTFLNAKELCERAIESDPLNGEAHATLARAIILLMRYYGDETTANLDEAIIHAIRAKELAPSSLETGLALAKIEQYSETGQAYGLFLELYEEFPDDVRVLYGLAELSAAFADKQEFKKWAAQVNVINGPDSRILAIASLASFYEQQYNETLDLAQQSHDIEPSTYSYILRIVTYILVLGEFDLSYELLEQLPPELMQQERALASSYLAHFWSREPDKALEVLSTTTKPFIGFIDLHYPVGFLRGEAYALSGRAAAADIEFRIALAEVEERLDGQPNTGLYVAWKARLLACLGDIEGAKEQHDLAIQMGAQPAAGTLVQLGLIDEYLDYLDRSITDREELGLIYYNTARFDPLYDPLREMPRFIEIMAKGEAWLIEVKEQDDRLFDW